MTSPIATFQMLPNSPRCWLRCCLFWTPAYTRPRRWRVRAVRPRTVRSHACARLLAPLLSLQVADSFNQLITLMSGISNFDDQFRRLEITANGTRYDLDALTDRCMRVMPACVSAFLPARTGRAHLGSHSPGHTLNACRATGMCLHSG